MGLNMDIDQIYFSNLKKFDGKKTRRLNLVEISQIAGRAGRYKNDGNFGTTGDCENLNSDEIENIQSHNLPNTNLIYWRNSKLNFESPEKLIKSLELKPDSKNLLKSSDSLDEITLKASKGQFTKEEYVEILNRFTEEEYVKVFKCSKKDTHWFKPSS